MKHNFITVKQMFVSAPCRAAPDFSPTAKPFIITIDSKTAIGAIEGNADHMKATITVKGEMLDLSS